MRAMCQQDHRCAISLDTNPIQPTHTNKNPTCNLHARTGAPLHTLATSPSPRHDYAFLLTPHTFRLFTYNLTLR